jgi:uncharacterized surface protein with fasciclin (FAS1) repeats
MSQYMSNIDTLLQSQSRSRLIAVDMSFNSLHTLLNAIGLNYVTQGYQPITLFAPLDYAFGDLYQTSVFRLLRDPSELTRLLSFHIVPHRLTTTDLANLAFSMDHDGNNLAIPDSSQPPRIQLDTLSGDPVTITLTDTFMVENANVRRADILADNGVIHSIDAIIWPPGLSEEAFQGYAPFSNSFALSSRS